MTSNITKSASKAIAAAIQSKADKIFEAADTSSASFQSSLIALGLDSKAAAKPYALRWAARKYHAKIEQGQRGETLPRNSDAERAMYRVLAAIYGSSNPFEGRGQGSTSAAAVQLPRGLVAKMRGEIVAAGLTKGQFNALLKALREEITFA